MILQRVRLETFDLANQTFWDLSENSMHYSFHTVLICSLLVIKRIITSFHGRPEHIFTSALLKRVGQLHVASTYIPKQYTESIRVHTVVVASLEDQI